MPLFCHCCQMKNQPSDWRAWMRRDHPNRKVTTVVLCRYPRLKSRLLWSCVGNNAFHLTIVRSSLHSSLRVKLNCSLKICPKEVHLCRASLRMGAQRSRCQAKNNDSLLWTSFLKINRYRNALRWLHSGMQLINRHLWRRRLVKTQHGSIKTLESLKVN